MGFTGRHFDGDILKNTQLIDESLRTLQNLLTIQIVGFKRHLFDDEQRIGFFVAGDRHLAKSTQGALMNQISDVRRIVFFTQDRFDRHLCVQIAIVGQRRC